MVMSTHEDTIIIKDSNAERVKAEAMLILEQLEKDTNSVLENL